MNCSGHSCHCGSTWHSGEKKRKQCIQGCVPCRLCVDVFTCAWEFCILWCSVSGVKEADLGIGLGEPHSLQDPMGWVGGLESPLLDTVGVLSATTTRGGETYEVVKNPQLSIQPNSDLCESDTTVCVQLTRPQQCWRTTSQAIVSLCAFLTFPFLSVLPDIPGRDGSVTRWSSIRRPWLEEMMLKNASASAPVTKVSAVVYVVSGGQENAPLNLRTHVCLTLACIIYSVPVSHWGGGCTAGL